MFFRADGGYFAWIDVDQSGAFEPGVDAVDFGAGPGTLRSMNGIVINRYGGDPLFDSAPAAFDLRFDYLFADENGDAARNFGPQAGFTEASPGYAERTFVADDVNGNGTLDPGEKIVLLATSKIKVFRYGDDEYRRGENLVDAPWDPDMLHGVGATGVIAAGQPGLSHLVGMAPDADLVMATDPSGGREYQLTRFCIDEGARVVLHEYAPWVTFHLDGSSELEQLIDETSLEGVVHVNPAGNLSTSQKLYKKTVAAGAATAIPIEAPDGGAQYMIFTLLWRDASRDLSLTLSSPGGQVIAFPPLTGLGFQLPIDATLEVAGYRDDSDRGTAMATFYVYPSGASGTITPGTWTLTVTDPSPPSADPLTLFGYVMDEVSGWGLGIHFPEDSSEDHLIGWPATADRGMAIAAYGGHDINFEVPGERSYYSGRGRRIDDVPVLWISAPSNPVVPARWEDTELAYLVYGGTSGASPHVAGASALILQNDPTLTGDGVKDRIRAGAVVDEATGAVPNEDYGHGKLDVYRAIFGQPAPPGSAPVVDDQAFTVDVGRSEIAVAVSDADGGAVTLEIDREYDGVYDETLSGTSLVVDRGEPGELLLKVRATDASGRTDQALLRVTVQPGDDDHDDDLAGAFYPAGGGCTVRGAVFDPQGGAAISALALAALAGLGRRRAVGRLGRRAKRR
jgi:subtilisin family serine protease